MNNNRPKKDKRHDFSREIGQKARRKQKAGKKQSLWFGLGMFGMVGWAVSIPTLIFLAVGIWIDSRYRMSYSWTLIFLVMGVSLGCLNAWYWVKRESKGD